MDALDFLIFPVYFGLFYIAGSGIANRNKNNNLYRLYYMRGLRYKLGGSFIFSMIYIFYYKGGDTINFYLAITPVFKLFFTNPGSFFNFVFSTSPWYPNECVYEACNNRVFYLIHGSASLTTIRIGSLIDLFCLNSFTALGLAFAFISYQFQFLTFSLIASLYPSIHKRLSWAFLMVPSVIFWSAGVGKDSIMLGLIMTFFYCFYNAVILKRGIGKYLIGILISGFLITLIRAFILFTLVPCLLIMTVTYYRNAVRSSMLRFLVGPILLAGGAGGAVFFVKGIGSEVQSYSIESLQKKAEGFQSWHTYLGKTEGGSTYSLGGGEVEYTLSGVLKQAPMALVYTLFGPFIWQVRNPIMLLSAVESLILLYFTFRMLANRKIYSLGGILISDHVITFCVPFSIILGIAIGLTSFNFGALVRYRIPITPFFATALIIINFHLTQSSARKT